MDTTLILWFLGILAVFAYCVWQIESTVRDV